MKGLPSGVTSFVGRRDAVASLKRALSESRLVTLTGVGGVGKTRLALHVAQALRRGFADGVHLVELGNLHDPSLVPDASAAALHLRDQSARSSQEALAAYLSDKHALILLDNCEHVVDACGDLIATLLAAAPGLRVLATSREPLNIAGEHVWPVAPLTVPSGEELDARHWRRTPPSRYEALMLFADRAAAVVPGFTLDDATLPLVARLCARLDGVPLAIELAAVRLRALSLEQILARLEDRFRLLIEGNRAALPRHQTLLAAVEWSYDLCSEPERSLWASCSVFAGEFDLEAAEYVCSNDELSADDVLSGIVGLVDKSILVRVESGHLSRYRMLETIRQYGLQRLAEYDATAQLRRRHRDYYLDLAERSDAESDSPRQQLWVERLRTERANLWAALDYCMKEPGETKSGLRMGAALWFYWIACGFVRDGRKWLDRALAVDIGPSEERARGLLIGGWTALLQGDNARGVERLEAGRRMALDLDDSDAVTLATLTLGLAALFGNDPAGAAPTLDRALAEYRATQRWSAIGLVALASRALAAVMLGEIERAVQLCEECRAICAASGERWAQSWATWVLGVARLVSGRFEDACAHLRNALEQKHELRDQLGIPVCVEMLGWVAAGGRRLAPSGDPVRGGGRDVARHRHAAIRLRDTSRVE